MRSILQILRSKLPPTGWSSLLLVAAGKAKQSTDEAFRTLPRFLFKFRTQCVLMIDVCCKSRCVIKFNHATCNLWRQQQHHELQPSIFRRTEAERSFHWRTTRRKSKPWRRVGCRGDVCLRRASKHSNKDNLRFSGSVRSTSRRLKHINQLGRKCIRTIIGTTRRLWESLPQA